MAKAFSALLPEYNLSRQDIFLTSKIPVWNPDPEWPSLVDCHNGLENILKELETDYLDLLLIHSPPDSTDERNKAWKCVEDFYNQGKSKAIGVSNYGIHHLEELNLSSRISPMVNQIYYNPMAAEQQFDLVSYCQNHQIHVTSFTSLGNISPNRMLNNAMLYNIAKNYDQSVAQVLLKWSLQQGCSVIPKSLNPSHIRQNIQLEFEISQLDMEKISKIFV